MKKIFLILAVLAAPLLSQLACGTKASPTPSAPVTVYVLVTATFTPTVTPEPPVINHITNQTVIDSNPPIQITLGATDPYGNPVAFSIYTQAAHGTAGIVGNTCTYTANSSYTGSDAFTFKCADTVTGAFASETVTVTDGP